MRKGYVLGLLAGTSLAFVATGTSAEMLKGADLKSKLCGSELRLSAVNSATATAPASSTHMISLTADGKASIKAPTAAGAPNGSPPSGSSTAPPSGGTATPGVPAADTLVMNDSGTWSVEGDTLCIDMEKSFKGDKTCFVDLTGSSITLTSTGPKAPSSAVTLKGSMSKGS